MAFIKTWSIRVGIGLVVAAFLYIGLKGMVISLWRTPDEPQIYLVAGADNRAMAVVLMPDNYVYFSYNEQAPYYTEMVLARTTGEYGTHYLWNIWYVSGGWFGLRFLGDGQKPVKIEATVLDKFVDADPEVDLPQDYFPKEGESRRMMFVITEDSLEFEGSPLHRAADDPAFLNALQERLPLP